LLRLRSHGINKLDDILMFPSEAKSIKGPNPWYYEMQELGYHYRITDIQAALAKSQLNKLEKFISRRREIAASYYEHLAEFRELLPAQPFNTLALSAHHLFVLRVDFAAIKLERGELMRKLRERNIISQVHYIPVPMHPYYRRLGVDYSLFKNAITYYRECLSLPIYFSLKPSDQQYVIDVLLELARG